MGMHEVNASVAPSPNARDRALTEVELKVVQIVSDYWRSHGHGPRQLDVAKALGYTKGGAVHIIHRLIDRGALRASLGKQRTLSVTDTIGMPGTRGRITMTERPTPYDDRDTVIVLKASGKAGEVRCPLSRGEAISLAKLLIEALA
jgi:hypothetical protein